MRIVYLGDVVAKSGRMAVLLHIQEIKEKYSPDVFLVNGENSAHGFGITSKICKEFFEAGIDVIITGNHVYDQKEVLEYLSKSDRVIRPLNFPADNLGKGFCEFVAKNGKKILITQLQGRMFMEPMDCPLKAIDALLKNYELGQNIDAIFVDIHAEATSEKLAIGHYLDGRVSMVLGTHTHVPTSDGRILKKKTAYQSDVGMCGDYDSVIGFETQAPIDRMLHKETATKLVPSNGEGSVFGVFVETDDDTGLAILIEQIKICPSGILS